MATGRSRRVQVESPAAPASVLATSLMRLQPPGGHQIGGESKRCIRYWQSSSSGAAPSAISRARERRRRDERRRLRETDGGRSLALVPQHHELLGAAAVWATAPPPSPASPRREHARRPSSSPLTGDVGASTDAASRRSPVRPSPGASVRVPSMRAAAGGGGAGGLVGGGGRWWWRRQHQRSSPALRDGGLARHRVDAAAVERRNAARPRRTARTSAVISPSRRLSTACSSRTWQRGVGAEDGAPTPPT